MVYQFKTMLFSNGVLTLFDNGIDKLNHFAVFDIDHMVVVFFAGQLVNRMRAIEIVLHHQASRLKLGQHPIHCRQTDIFTTFLQRLVHFLGTEVTVRIAFEHLKNFQPRQSYLQTRLFELLILCCHLSSPWVGVTLRRALSGHYSVEDDNDLNLKSTKLIVIAAFVAALSACSLFQPYQPELKQGNYVRPEQLQQLETGMTPAQVQFLLGTPMLTGERPQDRWVYPIQVDNGEFEHLEVEFEGGQVTRINRSS